MKYDKITIRGGFTLAEILTTVAIIAILLAVLLPALNQVGKKAANVKQKAQFHGIEIALETFRSDKGDYPASFFDNTGTREYTGSHRLAEAIVGRDGLGFHPDSAMKSNGRKVNSEPIYYPEFGLWADSLPNTDQLKQDNLAARKGPYMDLESSNAISVGDYPAGYNYAIFFDVDAPSYFLADSYKTVKLTSGRKTGMPILYYKANRLNILHDAANPTGSTYNVLDSGSGIVSKSTPSGPHPMTAAWFYSRTQNPNFANPVRPYRAESFILHSAGPDGLYGTADDVFNFDEEEK